MGIDSVSQHAWDLAIKTLHQNGGSLYEVKEHSPKALKAAIQAIQNLRSAHTPISLLSVKYLEAVTFNSGVIEGLPRGTKEAMEVMELQKALKQGGSKSEISQKIVVLFESLKDDYQALQVLRNTMEAHSRGSSRLYLLVYHDLDIEYGHKIITTINTSFANSKQTIKPSYMIYSDIDDTLQATLNDHKTNIQGFYPGAMEFYKTIAGQNHVTFLSARPDAAKPLWNGLMKKKMPQDLKFFGLYGTTGAFIEGLKYYIKKAVAKFVGTFLPEMYNKILERAAVEMLIVFAIDKRRNMDRDILLRPEMRPIMIGDCGEGDLILLLIKNSGTPNPIEDDRIPPELRFTINTLYAGFAHAISSPMTYATERPDPKYRDDFEKELNTYIFNNYVDNAIYAEKKGILTKDAARQVVDASRKWLELERLKAPFALQKGETADSISPARRYRILLEQSIQTFDRSEVSRS